jgi:trehalose/maltose hydrolase-like predicted phosphorylase
VGNGYLGLRGNLTEGRASHADGTQRRRVHGA